MKKAIIFAIAITLSGAVFANGLENFKSQTNLTALDMETINNIEVVMPMAAKKTHVDTIDNEAAFKKLQKAARIGDSTPYDVLEKLFEQATPATEKDLTGWYSGRSVEAKNPKKCMASLFVGRSTSLHSNGGPLFNNEKICLVSSLNAPEKTPDYYDNLANELIRINRVKLVIKSESFTMTFPEAEGIQQWFASQKATLQYRKSQGYIIERCFIYDESTGKILYKLYSYYFKNVTPID